MQLRSTGLQKKKNKREKSNVEQRHSLLKRAQFDKRIFCSSTTAECHCNIIPSTNVGIPALSYPQPKIRDLGFKIIVFPLFHVVKQTINTMTIEVFY